MTAKEMMDKAETAAKGAARTSIDGNTLRLARVAEMWADLAVKKQAFEDPGFLQRKKLVDMGGSF